MQNLDSLIEIKKFDARGILPSIGKIPDQMRQAWKEIRSLSVPESCPLARNVVISGMGGSALGGRIADSLLLDRNRTPIEVVTEFRLPNYVNKDTLVVLSSYSGNTEETLSAGVEAMSRGATIFCVTTGGKLAEFMEKNDLPGYVFNPKENPSGQPRMGLGYSIVAILAILARCEFISILETEIEDAANVALEFISDYGMDRPTEGNLAKKMARKLKNKIPLLVASEHLVGSVHALKNQLNENSKTLSFLFDLPELNHHLMEGLKNPARAKEFLHFLFFESQAYSKEVKIRYPVTIEVVGKNGIEHDSYIVRSHGKLNQIFEILIFGSFVSFYLAVLYDIDPAPIPWVDYFKEKLTPH